MLLESLDLAGQVENLIGYEEDSEKDIMTKKFSNNNTIQIDEK